MDKIEIRQIEYYLEEDGNGEELGGV